MALIQYDDAIRVAAQRVRARRVVRATDLVNAARAANPSGGRLPSDVARARLEWLARFAVLLEEKLEEEISKRTRPPS